MSLAKREVQECPRIRHDEAGTRDHESDAEEQAPKNKTPRTHLDVGDGEKKPPAETAGGDGLN